MRLNAMIALLCIASAVVFAFSAPTLRPAESALPLPTPPDPPPYPTLPPHLLTPPPTATLTPTPRPTSTPRPAPTPEVLPTATPWPSCLVVREGELCVKAAAVPTNAPLGEQP